MNVFFHFFSILALILNLNKEVNDVTNLSAYKYPSPKDSNYFYLPIIALTDIHGYIFSRSITPKNIFVYGGGSLLSSYINVIRSEFSKVLIFDSGNEYFGGIETNISNGKIVSDFYNYLSINNRIIGNQELGTDMNYIENILNSSNSKFLITNFRNESGHYYKFKNVLDDKYDYSQIYKFNTNDNVEIKVGVIGYTPNFEDIKKEEFSDIIFSSLNDSIKEEAKKLKFENKVNAVILLINYGINCNDKDELKLYTAKDSSICNISQCQGVKDNILYDYLQNNNKHDNITLVDVVLGGKIQSVSHSFFNEVPVVMTEDKNRQFNIVYLPFSHKTGELVRENIVIEGPVPICSKVDGNTKKCDPTKNQESITNNFIFHNYKIYEDKKFADNVLKPYSEEYSYYSDFICFNSIEEKLVLDYSKETILGNLLTDIIVNYTNADFGIINIGSFGAEWKKGPLYLQDIFHMNHYDNNLYSFETNGENFTYIIKTIFAKKLYPISGVQIFINKDNVSQVILKNGTLIENNKTYVFAMNDFLYQGGEDFREIFSVIPRKHPMKYGGYSYAMKEVMSNWKNLTKDMFYEQNESKRRIVNTSHFEY